jgi:hypothetical protein
MIAEAGWRRGKLRYHSEIRPIQFHSGTVPPAPAGIAVKSHIGTLKTGLMGLSP